MRYFLTYEVTLCNNGVSEVKHKSVRGRNIHDAKFNLMLKEEQENNCSVIIDLIDWEEE